MLGRGGNIRILRRLVVRVYQALMFVSKWPALIAVLLTVVVVIAGVLARYVFNNPIHWADEYIGYFMATVTLLPLAFTLRHAGHLRLTLLYQLFPRRAANYLELTVDLVSLGVIFILFIATAGTTIDSFVTGVRAYTYMLTPLGPVQLLMPIGLGIFSIVIVVDIIQRVRAWGTAERTVKEEVSVV